MAAINQTITLGELAAVVQKVADLAPASIRVAAQAHAMAVLREVIVNQMTGQRLGVVTGTARRSMVGLAGPGKSFPAAQFRVAVEEQTQASPTRVAVTIGSPLSYVKAHELGFTGRVGVRAHMAKRKVKAFVGVLETLDTIRVRPHQRIADGYADFVKGYTYQRRVKRKVYQKREEMRRVRGHSMMMNIRAKRFVRIGIYKLRNQLPERAKLALLYAAANGKVPKFSDVASVGGGRA